MRLLLTALLNDITFAVGKFQESGITLAGRSGTGNGQNAPACLIVIVGYDVNIVDMHLRTGIEIHLAGNTRQAPEVLVLQIRAVAPAHHLHGNEVTPRLHKLRQVKLGSYLRVLRVTHELAVHPHHEVAGGRAHMQQHLLAFPVLRQLEGAAVGARVVIGLADVGRLGLKRRAPGVADVLVDGVAVAVEFKQSGHGEVHPLGVVKVCPPEVFRRILMVFHEVKPPHALHRQVAP